jgi:AcrR family transcriptional regulator
MTSAGVTSIAGSVRRGRPRSEAIDNAIIQATIDELIERGFVSLSMEAIAARAGVAKTTLYRRWPSANELAIEAMRAFEGPVTTPPSGSARDELLWYLEGMRRKWDDPRYAAIMRRASADGTVQPEVYKRCRERLIAPHIKRMNAALRRAMGEGVIRDDIDVRWVRQMMVSPILAAALTHKDRLSVAQVETTLDVVLRGLAP